MWNLKHSSSPEKNPRSLFGKIQYSEPLEFLCLLKSYYISLQPSVRSLKAKSQTEALMHRGRGLKFPCNDRADELISYML